MRKGLLDPILGFYLALLLFRRRNFDRCKAYVALRDEDGSIIPTDADPPRRE